MYVHVLTVLIHVSEDKAKPATFVMAS